jgi:hypothetical protein
MRDNCLKMNKLHLTSSTKIKKGDVIETVFSDGSLESKVE